MSSFTSLILAVFDFVVTTGIKLTLNNYYLLITHNFQTYLQIFDENINIVIRLGMPCAEREYLEKANTVHIDKEVAIG